MQASKCPNEEMLLAFVQGDLDPESEDEVAQHSSDCIACDSKLSVFEQRSNRPRGDAGTSNVAQEFIHEEAFQKAVLRVRDIGRKPPDADAFEPTVSIVQPSAPVAAIEQTIDSESLPVATSGDTNSFADLNSLLEAKRGQTPPFKAERTLAQGGMGAVLAGEDKALQRRVAIKVMKPTIAESDEHRARFLEEAQITGQLEHPNIVPIHDLGKDADGNLYFTMKLVKGQSLGQILADMQQNKSEHSLTQLLNIVLKIADGLAFAHSKGVVHRDLKPDNIMVGDFGEVLVMDWGLAKLLGRNPASGRAPGLPNNLVEANEADEAIVQTIKSVRATDGSARTLDGTVQGTPAYMPPEQARGEIDRIDERSDVYSLGAILYEVLTLERPVEGKTLLDVVNNAAQGNIVPPEQRTPHRLIPAELSAVVMKAMQYASGERYQTVKDLERDITLFLGGRAVSAKEDSLRESLVKLIRRNKAVSSAVAIAATIILALATFSYIRITDERDRAVDNELAATENAKRAERNEQRALVSEQDARESESQAVNAQREQWEAALVASRQFALQAVELANVDQLDSAERRAKDAAIVAPKGPWQFFASGAIAMARVDYASAIELYNTALSKPDGEQPEIRAALSDALARQGSLGEAEALLAEIDKVDDWRILIGAGRVLYTAQKWKACQRPLARAIELMEREKDRPSSNLDEAKRLLDAAPAQLACVGFYDEIRNLPLPDLQERVAAKIVEIHGFSFRPDRLSADSSGNLRFNGQNWGGQSSPTHLYPLRGLPITSVNLLGSRVWDLSPLIGMPLTTLDVDHCDRLTDLKPLENSKTLERLQCGGSGVTDLTPLRHLTLKHLTCYTKNYAGLDLTPLRGMSLEELTTNTSDLSPLNGMPLRSLNISLSKVSNLEPLRGMALESLDCSATWVRDLSPLVGMPIRELNIRLTQVSDLSPLRDCPIEKIHFARTQVKDLSPLAATPLRQLNLSQTIVTDLGGLKGSRIETLVLGESAVTDLSPLAGLPLKRLELWHTRINDLSPLRVLPLEHLNLNYAEVTDLSPLQGSTLKDLGILGCWIKNYSPLATMPNLDVESRPWVGFLLGAITQRELYERYQDQHPDLTAEVVAKTVIIYVAMKEYGDGGPADAIPWLEKYMEKWGTTPPPFGKPEFIETHLKRLRDELAAQPDRANSVP